MTRLLLVRHGESEWNALGKWQGQANPPLTDQGRRQAQQAAGVLGAFDAIVASTLQRAAETAAIISEVMGVGPVLVEEDLQERSAGPWQGLTRVEIEPTTHGSKQPSLNKAFRILLIWNIWPKCADRPSRLGTRILSDRLRRRTNGDTTGP